jgi:hypothetical protein
MPTPKLEAIAGLPETGLAALRDEWLSLLNEPAPTSMLMARRAKYRLDPAVATRPREAGEQTVVLQGVPLVAGVVLLLPAVRALDSADIEALRVAADSVLRTVAARGLLPPEPRAD